METIAINGLDEEEFRRSIESKLRHGRARHAEDGLRALLEPYCGPGRILPERFLTVRTGDLAIGGWDSLGDSVRRHDRPGRPVTALAIAFAWPGEDPPQIDDEGRLSPLIEVSYYTDDAYPFSQSGRDDLLDGYSFHGCTWADDCEARDRALWLSGIDDLQGALVALEARLLASERPDDEEIRAGSLAACLLAVLLFEAVGERIERDGLPRPLCVMAGSNGVYPYFDAPVVGMPPKSRVPSGYGADVIEGDTTIPGPRYSSLLMTGIPRAQKRAVLVLEENEDEMAVRIARLRGLHHPPADVPPEDEHIAETAIEPLPGGPLLAKKPAAKSDDHPEDKVWDFRDLLGSPPPPRDGGSEPPPPPPPMPIAIEAEEEVEADELSPVLKAAPHADIPAWPFGLDWIEANPPPPPPATMPAESWHSRLGALWARLRFWLLGV